MPAESQRADLEPPSRGTGEAEPPAGGDFSGEDFLYHLYRGSELLQDNCVGEAKEELERALSMQPRDVEGQGLLGVVYFRLGMYPRAITIYEELIRACPREVTPRLNLALCYLKTGQQLPAKDALESVLALVPDHKRAWGYLGLIFERLGDHPKALASFERAGQPQMARRMRSVIEERRGDVAVDSRPPEQEAVREAAQAAADGMTEDATPGPFVSAESELASSARSGRWRAIEPGGVHVPPPSRPPGSSLGRFGPAVPPVPDSLAPRYFPPTAPPPDFGAAPPPSVAPPASVPVSRAPTASELGASLGLAVDGPALTRTEEGLVIARLGQGVAVRRGATRFTLSEDGALSEVLLARRARGRELGEPLGGATSPIVELRGSGVALVTPRAGHRTLLVRVEEGEPFFVREDRLLAFETALRFESGRLLRSDAEPLPVVQLAGSGLAALELWGDTVAFRVLGARRAAVPPDAVLAWSGRLLPRPLGASEAPGGVLGLVGFTGEGVVFACATRTERE